MDFRYYIDPATDEPHIYEHDVSEIEVEQVMRAPGEDFPAKRGARMKLGQTSSGRYLQVIYVPDKDQNGVFVVTAYELSGKAKTAFRSRQRRRPR